VILASVGTEGTRGEWRMIALFFISLPVLAVIYFVYQIEIEDWWRDKWKR
jgi:hypothetical protein